MTDHEPTLAEAARALVKAFVFHTATVEAWNQRASALLARHDKPESERADGVPR